MEEILGFEGLKCYGFLNNYIKNLKKYKFLSKALT